MAEHSIFICYRRDDAAYAARMIYTKLKDRFGRDRIFIDVDNIAPGDDFVERIDRYLQSCAVFIAVIGEHWLTGADGSRRLDTPTDFVRLELGTALKRPGVRIIPVLVHEKARMPDPKDLPLAQVRAIRDEIRRSVDELLAELDARRGGDASRS